MKVLAHKFGPTHENARTHSERRHNRSVDAQTGQGDQSDWSPVRIGDDRRTLTRVGPQQDKRTQDCSRIGMPPRTPSDVAETQKEQQMEIGIARV